MWLDWGAGSELSSEQVVKDGGGRGRRGPPAPKIHLMQPADDQYN